MNILPTPIPGLMVVETESHIDSRGSFARLYCDRELSHLIGSRRIVQLNHSRTLAIGSLRGMHFQLPPHAEMKLLRCLSGKVWDVAVDLRANSPTFLKWHAEELTSSNARMMVIPEGVAHGFQVLEANSELLYMHTSFYNPGAEGGIHYEDPSLGIRWPLTITNISKRDATYPLIDKNFQGLTV